MLNHAVLWKLIKLKSSVFYLFQWIFCMTLINNYHFYIVACQIIRSGTNKNLRSYVLNTSRKLHMNMMLLYYLVCEIIEEISKQDWELIKFHHYSLYQFSPELNSPSLQSWAFFYSLGSLKSYLESQI